VALSLIIHRGLLGFGLPFRPALNGRPVGVARLCRLDLLWMSCSKRAGMWMSRTGWRSWAERIDLSSRPTAVDRLLVCTPATKRTNPETTSWESPWRERRRAGSPINKPLGTRGGGRRCHLPYGPQALNFHSAEGVEPARCSMGRRIGSAVACL